MVKKLIWMIILLAVTACTVFLGDEVDLSFLNPTETAVCENCTVEPTQPAELLITETVEVVATEAIETETVEATEETTAIAEETAIPTATAAVTATEKPITDLFALQDGSPTYMENFTHTSEGCEWQGVAGQLFDKSGDPILNYIVKVTGSYNGETINKLSVTGLVADAPYGEGSYEIELGNVALDTEDSLSIQLFNTDGQAVTNPIKFDTFSSCSNNLILINFNEL